MTSDKWMKDILRFRTLIGSLHEPEGNCVVIHSSPQYAKDRFYEFTQDLVSYNIFSDLKFDRTNLVCHNGDSKVTFLGCNPEKLRGCEFSTIIVDEDTIITEDLQEFLKINADKI